MKYDELTAYNGDVTIPVYGTIADAKVYLKNDVDEAIAEKDKEISELKKKLMPCLNGDCILTCEVVEKYGKENAELKAKLAEKESLVKMLGEGESAMSLELEKTRQKLEDVQASMYADVVDANMENRRLKRALWMARAERAKAMSVYWYVKRTEISNWEEFNSKWNKIENLCRAKAESYL